MLVLQPVLVAGAAPASRQPLPGLPSVAKKNQCFHCGVCNDVRTVPQGPFLSHILGLSSRHMEIFRENGLHFVWYLLCLYPRPKSLTESEWTGQGQILMTDSGLCKWLHWANFECLTPASLSMICIRWFLPVFLTDCQIIFSPHNMNSWRHSSTKDMLYFVIAQEVLY